MTLHATCCRISDAYKQRPEIEFICRLQYPVFSSSSAYNASRLFAHLSLTMPSRQTARPSLMVPLAKPSWQLNGLSLAKPSRFPVLDCCLCRYVCVLSDRILRSSILQYSVYVPHNISRPFAHLSLTMPSRQTARPATIMVPLAKPSRQTNRFALVVDRCSCR